MKRRWGWLAGAAAVLAASVAVVIWGTPFIGSWSDRTRDVVEAFSWIFAIGTPVVAVAVWAGKGIRASRTRPKQPGLAGRALYLVSGALPTPRHTTLGQLRVKRAIASPSGADRHAPPHLRRDVERALDDRLRRGGAVLLHGPAAAGKTRTAAEALRRVFPDRPLLIPADGPRLRELVELDLVPAGCVVFLDDLERFLVPGGLDLALLQRLDPAVVVLATLRDDELARFGQASRLAADELAAGGIPLAAVDLLDQITDDRRIPVARELTDGERERARQLARRDRRIAQALAAKEGFAEYLAAGTAMVARWTVGEGPLFQVGSALITAAVECRRAGVHEPLPLGLLAALAREFVDPAWRDRADLPSAAEAAAWATRPVLQASSCLQPYRDGTLMAMDYLVDHADRGGPPGRGREVPDAVWDAVLDHPAPERAYGVGVTAYLRGRRDVAERAFRDAAEGGHLEGMTAFGVLCYHAERVAEAEKWWEDAAGRGHTSAMVNLGVVHLHRAERETALAWWHRAAGLGDPEAGYHLGCVEEEAGNTTGAEEYFRAAAGQGEPRAFFSLGELHRAAGRMDEAMAAFREAFRLGHPFAAFCVAFAHEEKEELQEAAKWFAIAAELKTPYAVTRLANVLLKLGDEERAEALFRRAAEDGDGEALAWLAGRAADTAESDRLYREAAEQGFRSAMTITAIRLSDRGDAAGAEHWYRKAAVDGEPAAMAALGSILHTSGRHTEAEKWYRRVLEAQLEADPRAPGLTDQVLGGCVVNLSKILRRRGKPAEAEEFLRRGAAADLPVAMTHLAAQLVKGRQKTEARELYRRAADAGDVDAQVVLGELALEDGDAATAEKWFTLAAEQSDVEALVNLAVFRKRAGDIDGMKAFLLRAADQGDVDAMLELGRIANAEQDETQAARWYGRAADHGSAAAMSLLAHEAMNREDLELAASWFARAAETGSTDDAFNCGNVLLSQGRPEEAAHWWKRAAAGGNLLATTNLGVWLERQGDTAAAVKLYQHAARGGQPEAMLALSSYELSRRNLEEAIEWAEQASLRRHTRAFAHTAGLYALVGDVAKAAEWYQLAAAIGDPAGEQGLVLLRRAVAAASAENPPPQP
ncbi:tetratricopeptide repeat protein [Amycolatopsis lexingtonensis]|uniref:tetratricopeptide repeat protein n=1 Tax=Amycolatopsis lexingtonensis TaxID=218822 RepID=UPI003F700164